VKAEAALVANLISMFGLRFLQKLHNSEGVSLRFFYKLLSGHRSVVRASLCSSYAETLTVEMRMASYNQAMKTIAAFLGLRHGDYPAMFDRLELAEPLAKSRIKSWFCSFQDHKYRKANQDVFLDFCRAVYMHIHEVEDPQFLASDSVGQVLEVCFAEVIPVLPLMAIKELAALGTEDPADRECTYSRSLHLLCVAWLDAESLQGGFATTREIANHRFSGVLFTAVP